MDRFGGPEELRLQTVPVPEPGPRDVLIRVETAGVGEWDPFEREGGYAEMLGMEPAFPYVLGSEGAGVVAAVGEAVTRFEPGDAVYAAAFLNPRGGFYSEYAAVAEDLVSHIPDGLSTNDAGVMSGVAITALRGIDDVLAVRSGESVMVFGASGGIGHIAVQFLERRGARVFAVASGADGVALVQGLGADACVDGRSEEVLAAARAFAPDGLDAALMTAGGAAAQSALDAVRSGGRAAYPNGVRPAPLAPSGVELTSYNGEPDREIIGRVNELIEAGPFRVHIAQTFPLERAADSHRALDTHYPGKLALRCR
jgi:NADPH:quinone reductase